MYYPRVRQKEYSENRKIHSRSSQTGNIRHDRRGNLKKKPQNLHPHLLPPQDSGMPPHWRSRLEALERGILVWRSSLSDSDSDVLLTPQVRTTDLF